MAALRQVGRLEPSSPPPPPPVAEPPKPETAEKYGLFEADKGFTSRATVIIDKSGKVAWAENHGLGNARDDKAILEALKKLS